MLPLLPQQVRIADHFPTSWKIFCFGLQSRIFTTEVKRLCKDKDVRNYQCFVFFLFNLESNLKMLYVQLKDLTLKQKVCLFFYLFIYFIFIEPID